jgi:hypothetical protein
VAVSEGVNVNAMRQAVRDARLWRRRVERATVEYQRAAARLRTFRNRLTQGHD